MLFKENGDIETESESEDDNVLPPLMESDVEDYVVEGEALVTRHALNVQVKEEDEEQRENIFHARCTSKTRYVV